MASILEMERIVGIIAEIISILMNIWGAIIDWVGGSS
jgi:hypothetical protein